MKEDRKTEDDIIGTVVRNKYRILNFISKGSFGSVYTAVHTVKKYEVAIKMVSFLFL